MTLTAGSRLGPYEIISAIGAGGMGEVYRARDARLGRDVAIKVLPVGFSTDVDRLHRFEREARAAAALNHPNILAVFDIGREADAPFIVSELLEGATLRDRPAGIPVRKAVAYAVAVARGLAAAHEKGITHRDLKPENVFITTDDHVKILDFGLAKLTSDPSAANALETMTNTEPGTVLGTVGYMSPEQVRGLAVDHRADLFSLGVVLYELVSGQRAFRRETPAETMAAILNDAPPELRAIERPMPPALARIIERCLEKSPAARFQTASDLAFALDALSDASGSATAVGAAAAPRRRGWTVWGAVALLLVSLAALTYQRVGEQPPVPLPMRFQISPTVDLAGPGNFNVSPDGRYLAFFGAGVDAIPRLWIRAMDSVELRSLPGSEAFGVAVPPPFWSPDSRFIVIDTGGKLKKLDVSGGPPQTLCDLKSLAVGGSWNRDGDIIVGSLDGGLLRVRDTGGVATPVTMTDSTRKEEFHILPTFLPDGRHFVYLRLSPSAPESDGIYLGTLDAKPNEQSTTPLLPYAVGITYAPATDSGPGHLLFLREGTLLAQPFDSTRLALLGNPVPVAERVGSFRDSGFFSASANNHLIYRTADTDFQLAWFDRKGTLSGRVSEPGGFRGAALSPDGTRAVASRINPEDPTKADLWLLDLSSSSGATRFTFGNGLVEFPVWSPDGKRIAFTYNKRSVHQKLASGEGDQTDLLQSVGAGNVTANGWSPDGQFLLYGAQEGITTKTDIWVQPSDGRKPVPFARTAFDEGQGRFSQNGRWIAYVSNQSGAFEVYVRAFTTDFSGGSAGSGGSVLISRGGGTAPRWRGDGREIFYVAPDGKMMAAEVSAGPEFRAGAPTPLFQVPSGAIVGDVSADGTRFLLVTPAGPSAMPPFTVVLNWTAGLKK